MSRDSYLAPIVAEIDALARRRSKQRAFARSMLVHLAQPDAQRRHPSPNFYRGELTDAQRSDIAFLREDREDPPTTLDSVAQSLNYMGIPARRGGKWSKTQVHRLMTLDVEHERSRKLDKLRDEAKHFDGRMWGEDLSFWRSEVARVGSEHERGLAEARSIADNVRDILLRPRVPYQDDDDD